MSDNRLIRGKPEDLRNTAAADPAGFSIVEEAEIDEVGQTILDEAKKVVYGRAMKEYGPARRNFETIAKLWSAIINAKGYNVALSSEQVVLCMTALKLARLCYDPHHHDSMVDVAGWIATIEKMEREA